MIIPLISIFLFYAVVLVSITSHEFAHGWAAYKLGDRTARDNGTLSLNPFKNIDLFGTIILPLLITLATKGTFPPIGYAKAVPINPYHFKNPKRDVRWVAMAGPGANILIALTLILMLKIRLPLMYEMLTLGVILNLTLAIFNIIPVPPLDGSRVFASFLPPKIAYNYLKMRVFGLVFIIIIVTLKLGFFTRFITPAIKILFNSLGLSKHLPF